MCFLTLRGSPLDWISRWEFCDGQSGVAFQVARAAQPQHAGHGEHESHRQESHVHVVVVAQDPDDDWRNDIAQRMNHENVQREAGRAHGRMRDIGQDGIGRAGVEEQAEASDEQPNPDGGKRRLQQKKKEWPCLAI